MTMARHPEPSFAGPASAAAYVLGQAARVGTFFALYRLTAKRTTPVKPTRPIAGATPQTGQILADLQRLMARDWANIRAGVYRLPHDLVTTPLAALRDTPAYLRDLAEVERRRHAGAHQEVFERAQREPSLRESYPRYYLQNFHYQTDGWFSDDSARIYDHQVEVLFGGGADAMRRMALVPLGELLARRGVRQARLLDLACGTGRFLTFVKDNYPCLDVTALDLSPAYLRQARHALRPWRGVTMVQAPAEATGLPGNSFDAITCVYLFHELPAKVRRAVLAEAVRLLRPGGRLILVDSIQRGDVPAYDGLLDYFPVAFHEPYYADYIATDLEGLARDAGFMPAGCDIAYFSRIMAFDKPHDASGA